MSNVFLAFWGCVTKSDTIEAVVYPEIAVEQLEVSSTIVGTQALDQIGFSIAANGDFDGDQKGDVLVGAFRSTVEDPGVGTVYFLSGEQLGEGPVDLSQAPALTGDLYGACAGASIAFIPDWNGDQRDEVAIGAPCVNRVYIVEGRENVVDGFLGDADYRIFGEQVEDFLGWSVANVGDVNGDGRSDLLLGADGANSNGNASGSVYLILEPLPESGEPIMVSDVAVQFRGDEMEMAGGMISAAGDTDGDGFADFLVGAVGASDHGMRSGKVYHVSGASEFPHGSYGLRNQSDVIVGTENSELGRALSTVGDIDADGRSDILVGAPGTSYGGTRMGSVYVFLGSSIEQFQEVDAADIQIQGFWEQDHTGFSVCHVRDFDQDGIVDIVVGAPSLYHRDRPGGVFLFSGADIVQGGVFSLEDAAYMVQGKQAGDAMGYSIVSGGDIDNDGLEELWIGAPGIDESQRDQGAIYGLTLP